MGENRGIEDDEATTQPQRRRPDESDDNAATTTTPALNVASQLLPPNCCHPAAPNVASHDATTTTTRRRGSGDGAGELLQPQVLSPSLQVSSALTVAAAPKRSLQPLRAQFRGSPSLVGALQPSQSLRCSLASLHF
eukprot:s10448_g1.t1